LEPVCVTDQDAKIAGSQVETLDPTSRVADTLRRQSAGQRLPFPLVMNFDR